jgi:spore coat protein A
VGGAVGATALGGGLGSPFGPGTARGQTVSGSLMKFVDPLPILGVLSPTGSIGGVALYDVNMKQFKAKLHRDLPPATLWGYNGFYPGPTFEVRTGRPIAVRWRNSLPLIHPLPIDPTIHGAERYIDGQPNPQVRTVVHVHGARVMPDSDGYPEAWFTNGFGRTGPFFSTQVYQYPNEQPATTLWYHDHALGSTRLNVYMGLSGFFLIRDDAEAGLNLPSGAYEIPLMIQDRMLNPDGTLFYPVQPGGDPNTMVPPVWVPEFFGDIVLVNGKVWPRLKVEARKYRFRIVNASNARFYHLTLNQASSSGEGLGNPGPLFYQIGTDEGFLPAPVPLDDLTIAPAERFDLVIDFTGLEGQYFVLNNDAPAPYPGGGEVVPTDVMLFQVTPRTRPDTSSLPSRLVDVPLLKTNSATAVRDLVLVEYDSDFGNPIIGLINDRWDGPVTETPRAGATEIWRIINTTGDAHPIHVHLVRFQIVDRRAFDVNRFPQQLQLTGPPKEPPPNERPAFKDTVKSFPGEVTRIIAKFDLPSAAQGIRGQSFRYVFHCHILEHEDNEMMRPYDVVS